MIMMNGCILIVVVLLCLWIIFLYIDLTKEQIDKEYLIKKVEKMELKVINTKELLFNSDEKKWINITLRLEGEGNEFKDIDLGKLFSHKTVDNLNDSLKQINGENDVYYLLIDKIIRKLKNDPYDKYQEVLLRFIIDELKQIKS